MKQHDYEDYEGQDDDEMIHALNQLGVGCANVVASLIVLPFTLMINGYVIQYMWNHLIINIFDISPILLWQAVSIDLLITYITGYAHSDKIAEQPVVGRVAIVLLQALLMIVIVNILKIFI